MRIVLTSLGTIGDIRPFVALALELRRHGHEPIFALPSVLLAHAQQFGFDAIQLGPDLRELHEAAMRHAARGERDESIEAQVAFENAMLAALPQALQELLAVSASADLLIGADVMPLGLFVHDMTGLPYVSVQVWYPISFPALDESVAGQHPINLIRAQMGLPLLREPRINGTSPQLALIALSRELLPADLPLEPHQHITGSFFVEQEVWQPDADLQAFLDAGPRPILITLGSAMHDDPAAITSLFVEAVTAAGCRAIIQQGWSGLGAQVALPETVYAAEYLSHDWIFPRLACVVHHGGAGTTATTLRAGVPTVVIPHHGDQGPLAQRTMELGCTAAIIPYLELTAERLRDGLTEALSNERYRVAAREVSQRVHAEQGVQTARALIEQLMATQARPGGSA